MSCAQADLLPRWRVSAVARSRLRTKDLSRAFSPTSDTPSPRSARLLCLVAKNEANSLVVCAQVFKF